MRKMKPVFNGCASEAKLEIKGQKPVPNGSASEGGDQATGETRTRSLFSFLLCVSSVLSTRFVSPLSLLFFKEKPIKN